MLQEWWCWIERKAFRAKMVGEEGGIWLSVRESSNGGEFSLGFEREEVSWLMDILGKAVQLEEGMGFARRFRGRGRSH